MQFIIAISLLPLGVLSAPMPRNLPPTIQCIRDGNRWCAGLDQPDATKSLLTSLGPVLPDQQMELSSASREDGAHAMRSNTHVDFEKRDEDPQEQGNANDESDLQNEDVEQQAKQEDEQSHERRDEVEGQEQEQGQQQEREQAHPGGETQEQAEEQEKAFFREVEAGVQRRKDWRIPGGAGYPASPVFKRARSPYFGESSATLERWALSNNIGDPYVPLRDRSIPAGADSP